MVEVLLVVAIALGVLCHRRLGLLLRRGEEFHSDLEARLDDRIRAGMNETARCVQESTASSLASLGDAVFAQLDQSRLSTEQKLADTAMHVVESSRRIGERLAGLSTQVLESTRRCADAIDALGRQTSEEAERTRRELAEGLGSLQRSLSAAMSEIRARHEQALRELRGPIRQARGVQQEIRRARDQQGWRRFEAPLEASAASDASRMEDRLDQIFGLEVDPKRAEAPDATRRAGGTRPSDGSVAQEIRPIRSEPRAAARRSRRLAGLLGLVRRRARHAVAGAHETESGRR